MAMRLLASLALLAVVRAQAVVVESCDEFNNVDDASRAAVAVTFDIVALGPLDVTSVQFVAAAAYDADAANNAGRVEVTSLGGAANRGGAATLLADFALPSFAEGDLVDIPLDAPFTITNNLGQGFFIRLVNTQGLIKVNDADVLGGVCQSVFDLYFRGQEVAFIVGEDDAGRAVLFNGAICYTAEREEPGEPEPAVEDPPVDLADRDLAAGEAPTQLRTVGVNLAGIQFGLPNVIDPAVSNLPGYLNLDYFFPNVEEIDYYLSVGMNVFRINLRWERLQPVPSQDFDECSMLRINELVERITNAGGVALLNLHQPANYEGENVYEDGSSVTLADFADFWSRIATIYAGNDNVYFNILDQTSDIIRAGVDAEVYNTAIEAIRAAGVTSPIVIRVVDIDSIVDPLDNIWLASASAETRDCTTPIGTGAGPDYDPLPIRNRTELYRANGWTGYIISLGVLRTQECYEALDELMEYLSDNADVWAGFAYWSAGPAWGGYPFSIEPTGEFPAALTERQQMTVLRRHLPALGA